MRQLIVKQTGCLPFVQVAPKCQPFAQDTTKQRYLSRKATMGIFGLYERSHIKRYLINQMLYWLHVCICLRLLVWNAGRSHVKKNIICKKVGRGKGALPLPVRRLCIRKVCNDVFCRKETNAFCISFDVEATSFYT